ncbi:MAG: hypothetical protein JSV16_01195 [Candidatus Hydrogenedentota bacterium]|nr:MAG: hypothetical protein JSV16_01195 [Candidatus Hydrogenedentota bacterium]
MPYGVSMTYNQLSAYMVDGKTPATRAMDALFQDPPRSIPDELKQILAKDITTLTPAEIAIVEGLMNSPEEATHFWSFPPGDLKKMNEELNRHCVGNRVPAEFFSRLKAIPSQKIEIKVTPTKLEVTFCDPEDKTFFKMV